MVVPYAEPFSVTTSLREDTAWAPRQGYATFAEQTATIFPGRNTSDSNRQTGPIMIMANYPIPDPLVCSQERL